jgi:hypothetical protein
MNRRKMRIGMSILGVGYHPAAWRDADVPADGIQRFENDACDGFNITSTHLPGGCEDFVDMLIPELQRRGLFRIEYEGKTLRESLGLKPSVNRYVAGGERGEAE